jgi:hypothetical protein
MLDRRVEELACSGKGDDVVKPVVDLLPTQAMQARIEINVRSAAGVGVETGSDLEQRGETPADAHLAGRGNGDAGQDLEQG